MGMGQAGTEQEMGMRGISAQENSLRHRLEQAFEAGLPLGPKTEAHLAAALASTLRRPGNMVRAVLAFRVSQAFGLSEDRSEKLGLAIEYFHTASLLFDDLPCMDDAKHRRGAPCAHERFGEGAAILAALGLVNRAYGLLWAAVVGLEANQQSRALSYVERQLGVAGLLNGQSQDIHYSALRPESAHPQEIALGKTVSLIRLSLVMPAILGGATPRETQLLERVSLLWGLAYQTLDDLKDVLHTSEAAGKTAARDAHLDRPNLALAIGVEAAFARVERLMELSDRAIARLAAGRREVSFLAALRGKFEKEIASLRHAQAAEARLALAS